ncbi:hypothetical protein ACCT11_36460, partial [Rhizobium johnstonii]|uniref:hypothetical protein n=1 Tax=Rhizobium johnstonii TaxID=3019933 RepID=UPI003F97AFFD
PHYSQIESQMTTPSRQNTQNRRPDSRIIRRYRKYKRTPHLSTQKTKKEKLLHKSEQQKKEIPKL